MTDAPSPEMLGCREEGEAGIHAPGQKSLISNFQYCFDGFGTFNMKPYHIVLDPKTKPVVQIPRAVPVHLHKMFKYELDQMGEFGVIVSVKRPTEWVKTTNDDEVVRTTHILVIKHSRCDIEKLTLTTLCFRRRRVHRTGQPM